MEATVTYLRQLGRNRNGELVTIEDRVTLPVESPIAQILTFGAREVTIEGDRGLEEGMSLTVLTVAFGGAGAVLNTWAWIGCRRRSHRLRHTNTHHTP